MIELRGITWEHPRGFLPLAASAAAYRRLHPDVSVSWEQRPWYEFEQAVLRGEGHDLVMLDHPWLGHLVGEGMLVPFDDIADDMREMRADTVGPSFDSYVWDGRLWAMPVDAACMAMVYRRDLLAEPPSTWAETLDLARTVHHPPHRYGMVFSRQGVQAHCALLTLLAGQGAEPYTRGVTLQRSAARRALQLMADCVQLSPPGSGAWNPWDVYDRLVNDDIAAFSPLIFGYVNYFDSRGHPELRIAEVPRLDPQMPSRPLVGGVGLAVSAASRHRAEAAAYARYVMSAPVQGSLFHAEHGQPGRRSAWLNAGDDVRRQAFYTTMLPKMERGYVRPRFDGFHELELQGGTVVNRFLDGDQSLESCLDDVESLYACRPAPA